MERVAVMGLGIMGSGIARNLVAAGHEVAVWNRTRSRAEAIAGARVAATPREVAAGAEVVLACVSDDEASRAVWLGANGAFAGASSGAVVIETGTLSTAWIAEWATEARRRGLRPLDAPISGSRPAIEARSITLFVGGDEADLAAVRGVLSSTSKAQLHCGPTGSGARMKLINNMVGASQAAALAEGLVLAERCGLDMAKVADVLSNGSCGSPFVRSAVPRMLARDYATNFATRWMVKDLDYALAECAHFGIDAPIGHLTRARYQAAADAGHADADLTAVVELARRT